MYSYICQQMLVLVDVAHSNLLQGGSAFDSIVLAFRLIFPDSMDLLFCDDCMNIGLSRIHEITIVELIILLIIV